MSRPTAASSTSRSSAISARSHAAMRAWSRGFAASVTGTWLPDGLGGPHQLRIPHAPRPEQPDDVAVEEEGRGEVTEVLAAEHPGRSARERLVAGPQAGVHVVDAVPDHRALTTERSR